MIYSKTLDECFPAVGGSAGISTPVNATISFIHAPDEIKELQNQRNKVKTIEEQNRLDATVKEKLEYIAKNVQYEHSVAILVGYKTIYYTPRGQTKQKSLTGITVGFGANISKGVARDKGMKESETEKYQQWLQGDRNKLDWY